MIWTSCKNAPACVSLNTPETDPQLHPGSARSCGKGRLSGSCGLLFPSHLGWIQIRSWENNCNSHHWNKITGLSFTRVSLCLVPREEPLQPVPGGPRGMSGRRLHRQVATGRDVQSARKKMSFELLETCHQLVTRRWRWHRGLGSFSELLLGVHHHIRGFASHCAVVYWSPLLSRHYFIYDYIYDKLKWHSSHGFHWNKKQIPVFCQ